MTHTLILYEHYAFVIVIAKISLETEPSLLTRRYENKTREFYRWLVAFRRYQIR